MRCEDTILDGIRLQAQPHFKDGTAYRQVRPTKLDKIKNLLDQVRSGGVIGRLSTTPERRSYQAPVLSAGVVAICVVVPQHADLPMCLCGCWCTTPCDTSCLFPTGTVVLSFGERDSHLPTIQVSGSTSAAEKGCGGDLLVDRYPSADFSPD